MRHLCLTPLGVPEWYSRSMGWGPWPAPAIIVVDPAAGHCLAGMHLGDGQDRYFAEGALRPSLPPLSSSLTPERIEWPLQATVSWPGTTTIDRAVRGGEDGKLKPRKQLGAAAAVTAPPPRGGGHFARGGLGSGGEMSKLEETESFTGLQLPGHLH
ncbi:UNVERIFIED_CONTAM: hypothetical protein K2H54_002135 [Gekko kuhli]